MKIWLYALALVTLLSSVPAAAQTVTVRTPNQRFLIVDRIYRTTSTVFGVLDTDTGKIEYQVVPLPARQIKVSTRTWDPYSGKFREIVGYDGAAFPVYRDEEDYSRIEYWVVARDELPVQAARELPAPAGSGSPGEDALRQGPVQK
jgi:hypothetical protein